MLWLVPPALRAEVWLVMGDSISAGLGVEPERGWVALLAQRLQAQQVAVDVVNASVIGEISAGGLARLPALLAQYKPSLVILELGGNDGLRGLSLANLESNLARMVTLSRDQGARVVLLGMLLPPNYGQRYTQGFAAVYSNLAERERLPWIPFFLEGVVGVPGMMQADGIHPTTAAQPVLLGNVWPVLQPLLPSSTP